MRAAQAFASAVAVVGLSWATVALAADAKKAEPVPTSAASLLLVQQQTASSGNNGNHGSKSVDNSRNCTKNNDNNAQNQGNCPGSP